VRLFLEGGGKEVKKRRSRDQVATSPTREEEGEET